MRDVESFLEANDGSMTIYGFIDREGQVPLPERTSH